MGGTSSSTQQTSQTQKATPWQPAQAGLTGVLQNVNNLSPNPTATENSAFNNLVSLGQAGNPFAGGIENAANSMLTGGPDRTGIAGDAYAQFQGQNDKTAGGYYTDPNKNPWFSQTTNSITNNVRDQLNQAIAGSGKADPMGYGSYGGILGQKIAEGLAPTYANQYNQERGLQENAIGRGLTGGLNTATTMGGLDAQRFGNQAGGINAANASLQANAWGPGTVLAAEAARRGVPIGVLAAQMGLTLPAAQAFGTTTATGNSQGSQTMSGAEQFKTIAAGMGSLGLKLPSFGFGYTGAAPPLA